MATDVAGRGIDIHDVSMVVNYDMAKNIEGEAGGGCPAPVLPVPAGLWGVCCPCWECLALVFPALEGLWGLPGPGAAALKRL